MHRILFLTVLIPSCAAAAQISDGRAFAFLCGVDMSEGFSWVKDHWEPARFHLNTYLVKKKNAINLAYPVNTDTH